MYTGHLGVALAARRFGRVPLWALILASQFPDWVSVAVGATGKEDALELWSHSLPAVAIGATLTGLVSFLIWRRARSSVLLVLVYLSHPVLDLITGLKPTWPSGPLLGGCLYDWPVGDFVVEGLVVSGGLMLYGGCLQPARRVRTMSAMLGIALVCQLGAVATHAHRLAARFGTSDTESFFGGHQCR